SPPLEEADSYQEGEVGRSLSPSLRADRGNPVQRAPGMTRRFAPRNDDRGLQLGEGHPALAHIFAGAVGIAGLAGLVALEEEELAGALIGVDLGGERRRVAELQRDMALPAGLERGHVHDDAAARIGGLAEADDE